MGKLIICFFNVEINPSRLVYYINIIIQQITLVQNHMIINLYKKIYVSCQYCSWMWSETSCILNETNFNWLCTWTQNGSSMIVKCHSDAHIEKSKGFFTKCKLFECWWSQCKLPWWNKWKKWSFWKMKSNKNHLPILMLLKGLVTLRFIMTVLNLQVFFQWSNHNLNLVMEEQLELESNALITQRMEEKCLRNMSFKHEVQYKKLEMKLDAKELSSKN